MRSGAGAESELILKSYRHRITFDWKEGPVLSNTGTTGTTPGPATSSSSGGGGFYHQPDNRFLESYLIASLTGQCHEICTRPPPLFFRKTNPFRPLLDIQKHFLVLLRYLL